jgi:large conductance mechanosensitive channel
MKKLLEEFKAFAMRGNVVDLAVAVVIGSAFGKIVSSITDDVIMPFISFITGRFDFSNLKWVLREGTEKSAEVSVKYGSLLNAVITFVIVAFVIFMIIKVMNRLQKQKEKDEKPAKEAKITKDQELLIEIRDLLKK